MKTAAWKKVLYRQYKMKRQYFFKSYNWKNNGGLNSLKYCPACGTKCVAKEESLRIRPACPGCGFVHYRNPCPGVVVLIEQEGKILLGKRLSGSFQAGKWCLPGGFIEFDEDFIAAAMREVKEETNLDIEVQSILNVSSNFLASELHTLVVTLFAIVLKGVPEPGDDIEELRWFQISGKLPDMAFQADTYMIKHFNDFKPKALSLL
jgi:8-oxo-dGTP diphosphatase